MAAPMGGTIRERLLEFYENRDDLDRLYVYFARHGMLGHKSGSVTAATTVLMPSDVTD
jgi:hypothetical protein